MYKQSLEFWDEKAEPQPSLCEVIRSTMVLWKHTLAHGVLNGLEWIDKLTLKFHLDMGLFLGEIHESR